MQNKKDLSNRRFIYISDPSSIARLVLPENVGEKHLREWVDDLYEVEGDTFIQEVYTQGWTTYWKTPLFEYDARPQHRRFLPLIESGGPLTCLGFAGVNFCQYLAKLARADEKRCIHRSCTCRVGRGQECGLEA